MLSPTLQSSLNKQCNQERANAAAYRAMAWELDADNWPGCTIWMTKSSREEEEHAEKIAAYIVDQNGVPVVDSIYAVSLLRNTDIVQYFQTALELEKTNTELLKVLYFEAERAEDAATCIFLQWFITEQVSSERELTDIIQMLQRLDNNGRVFYDKEIGTLK